ncbi:hypothetical protein D3C85_1774340 [compost metagenome]
MDGEIATVAYKGRVIAVDAVFNHINQRIADGMHHTVFDIGNVLNGFHTTVPFSAVPVNHFELFQVV